MCPGQVRSPPERADPGIHFLGLVVKDIAKEPAEIQNKLGHGFGVPVAESLIVLPVPIERAIDALDNQLF